MFVVLGTEMGTDSISQLLGSEKPGGLHHLALAVGPPRLDWIQPGALDRQVTRDDPNPFAFLLHLAVVASNPAAHFLADMPRSVVPRHQERLLAKPGQPIYGPFQEPYRHRADRPTVDESQPDHLFDRPVGVYQSDQEAIGREGFRVGIVFGDRLLDQAERAGWATRLHQVSSSKPSTHSGCTAASRFSRSRALFFGRTRGRDW